MRNGRVIAEIQSLGVRFQPGFYGRSGGAGPAEAGFLMLGEVPVSVPVSSPFVVSSPYELYELREGDGVCVLFKHSEPVADVTLIKRPVFYDYVSKAGIPYEKLALLHGTDCLATTLIQRCSNWRSGRRCLFCGIEISLETGRTIERKDPRELAEVALAAKESCGVSHLVLTTGAADPPIIAIAALKEAASAISRLTGLPIHAQFLPPEDPGVMEELRECGVSSVGIHIESPSEDLLSVVAPAKAALGKKAYVMAWQRAVEIFGENQVSSFIIAGLGEDENAIVKEAEFMANIGVYPFVVPFRPIPGSMMENSLPPAPAYMISIYEEVSKLISLRGLSWRRSRAGCVRCGACSALRAFEEESRTVVRRAELGTEELAAAFAIRKEVFVYEQGIFKDTDRDEDDQRSIHLVAVKNGSVIGTVRVFPVRGMDSEWMGGRLAIKKSCRANGVGELLVREAVRTVKAMQCRRFSAMIQEENVKFFERLGWRSISDRIDYRSRPHRLMEADLDGDQQGDFHGS